MYLALYVRMCVCVPCVLSLFCYIVLMSCSLRLCNTFTDLNRETGEERDREAEKETERQREKREKRAKRERERERECKIPLYNLDSESNLDMRSILNPL